MPVRLKLIEPLMIGGKRIDPGSYIECTRPEAEAYKRRGKAVDAPQPKAKAKGAK